MANAVEQGTLVIDFTGSVPGSKQFKNFDDQVTALIRESDAKLFVVVDKGAGFGKAEPHVVSDHINLTGNNPLVGPNDSIGQRFPIVKDIYVTDKANGMPIGIAAGLKTGCSPSAKDVETMRSFGCDFYCYNLVPTMIIAAHAGKTVLGIVVPEGTNAESIVKKIME